MKSLQILVAILILLPFTTRGETPDASQMRPEDAMRMYQAQMQMKKMEEDYNNPPKVEVKKNRAALGSRTAPITIVEFSDFQCPYCKKGAETVQEIRKKYGNKVFFAFKHLPLQMHQYAMTAAKYFEAIAIQNGKKAYEFHDAVFSNQEAFSAAGEPFLAEQAKKLGVNMTKLKKDMDSEEVTKRIQEDMELAKALEFSGTPGYVVAGVRMGGAYPAEQFSAIIDRRLAEKKKK